MIFKKLHYLSYLSPVLFTWGCIVSLPEIIERTPNVISNIGFGIFMFGLALSLEGFKDQNKFSKSEKKNFSSKKRMNFTFIYYSFFYIFSFLLGTFMFNLDIFYPSQPESAIAQFEDIGYGCFSLAIGGFNHLKMTYEKYQNFIQKNEALQKE
ncbi:MAG: hypothetical protein ACEPO8_08120 [Rhodothermaceae bacterium]